MTIICLAFSLPAQVSGVVYLDFNASGTLDNSAGFSEVGFGGVTVTGFGADGTTYGPVTSASDGSYTLAGVNQPTRIEFTFTEPWLQSGAFGGSSVQFVSGASSNINFAVQDPADYCQDNPYVVTPAFRNGDPLAGGSSASSIGLFGQEYDDFTLAADVLTDRPDSLLPFSEIGATWGNTYDKVNQVSYVSAFLKRHSGFGPLGPGGIYRIDMSDPLNPVVTNWLTVPNVGADPRIGNPLPAGIFQANRDAAAYGLVGKMSLGGLDVSEDGSTLYAVNLNTRSVEIINTATATIDDNIPITFPGLADLRPWNVQIYRGEIYVTVTDSKEGTTDIPTGHLLRWDGASWVEEFQFSFDYPRDNPANNSSSCDGSWNAWDSDPANFPARGCAPFTEDFVFYPQPIFSDFEFDVDGSLIIGVIDRFNVMSGALNFRPTGDNQLYSGITSGDVLRACNVNGNLVFEGSASCPYPNTAENEWYYGDYSTSGAYDPLIYAHGETSQGAIALVAGTQEVMNTSFNPIPGTTDGFGTGGLKWYSNSGTNAGFDVRGQTYYKGEGISKAYGLGDVEPLCAPAPVEIGNYVWEDTDQDGIQDPDENPISGIQVELYDASGTTLLATATTNADGEYIFSNDPNRTSNGSFVYNISALQSNTNYLLRFPLTSGMLQLTALDAGSKNTIDSDAATSTGEVIVQASDIPVAGANNHTFDVGYSSQNTCVLSDIGISNVACNDNGSGDLADDFITFNLNPSGTGTASAYTVSVNNGATVTPAVANYGTITSFALNTGTADGTNYTITVTDNNDPNCSLNTNVLRNPCSATPCPDPNCVDVNVNLIRNE